MRDAQARAEIAAATLKAHADAVKALGELGDHQRANAAADTAAAQALAKSAAEKASADAATLSATAEAAALKARLGTIAANTAMAGSVNADPNAGTGEAAMLAARALDAAARKIAAALGRLPELAHPAKWLVFTDKQRPTVDDWRLFSLKSTLVEDAFARADTALAEAFAGTSNAVAATMRADDRHEHGMGYLPVGALGPVGAAVSGAGAALDLAAKVATYFTSDFKAGPVALDGIDDDLLALCVAGRLSHASYSARWSVHRGVDEVAHLLDPLQALHDTSLTSLGAAQAGAKAHAESAPDAARFAAAADLFRTAQKAFDDWMTSLAVADAGGVALIARVLDARALADAIAAGARLLFVRVNKAAGGYYTEKNLWTAFGSMPFHVMGGVVASYCAVHGKSGEVLASGQAVEHGGYHSIDEVAGVFGKRWGHRD